MSHGEARERRLAVDGGRLIVSQSGTKTQTMRCVVTPRMIAVNSTQKLARVVRAIEDQKQYITRVPDPDNRSTAEINLSVLVELREQLSYELSNASGHRETEGGAVARAYLI